MRWILAVVLAGALWSTATASNYVCGDATKLGYYAQAVDPSAIPLCPAPFTVAEVPEADIPAQTALYNTVIHRHLKVVGGLMAEMDAGEKQTVDAPLLAEQAHTAAMQDELMTQEYCSTKTLQQVTTKVTNKLNQINANIDAITNLQTGKDADHANFTITMQLIEQTARCVIAMLELRR